MNNKTASSLHVIAENCPTSAPEPEPEPEPESSISWCAMSGIMCVLKEVATHVCSTLIQRPVVSEMGVRIVSKVIRAKGNIPDECAAKARWLGKCLLDTTIGQIRAVLKIANIFLRQRIRLVECHQWSLKDTRWGFDYHKWIFPTALSNQYVSLGVSRVGVIPVPSKLSTSNWARMPGVCVHNPRAPPPTILKSKITSRKKSLGKRKAYCATVSWAGRVWKLVSASIIR